MTLSGECLHDDALDAFDVDEFEVECPAARVVDTRSAILVDKPQQLLTLTEICPREVAAEEMLGENA